ncbi:hypothetical protein LINGRAHAP2_LOCUS18318 [Linum grandiflorum]
MFLLTRLPSDVAETEYVAAQEGMLVMEMVGSTGEGKEGIPVNLNHNGSKSLVAITPSRNSLSLSLTSKSAS